MPRQYGGKPVLIDGKPDRQEDPVITRTSDNNYHRRIDFYDEDGNVYAQDKYQWRAVARKAESPLSDPGVQLTLNIEADVEEPIVWMDSRNPSKDPLANAWMPWQPCLGGEWHRHRRCIVTRPKHDAARW